MLKSSDFILGVNYWPRRKAMSFWQDFDSGEVKDEFSLIRELGLKMVRIFLFWEDFQPSPHQVSKQSINDLLKVADIAHDLGLGLNVTFFTGHMSGPNWAPEWMLEGPAQPGAKPLVSGGRVRDSGMLNPYTDPKVLGAERMLIERVVGELRSHPGVCLYNLGNEPDLLARPPDAQRGSAWAREMSALVRSLDPKRPVTCGLHAPNLAEDRGLRVDQVFEPMDLAVMHGYSLYTPWLDHPLDDNFVPFLCALTAALSKKPTLMEEFGGCTSGPGKPSYTRSWERQGATVSQLLVSEEALAKYVEAVLPKLVQVGSIGAVLWCFADYAEPLWDRPPCDQYQHERFFGLVRPDGSLKPHAEVVRKFAESAPQRLAEPPSWFEGLDGDNYYADPLSHMKRLYREFTARTR